MSHLTLQGSWSMEADTMKGVFIRKDNGKQLTTTRVVQGDELIQVKYKREDSVAAPSSLTQLHK